VTSTHFILNGHPYDFERGDATMARRILEVASDFTDVEGTALWSHPPASSPFPITCIPRPPVRLLRLAARGAVRRRSIIHTRFDVPALSTHLRGQRADSFVAIKTYMAEPFLSAFPEEEHPPLRIAYDVAEGSVLRATGRLRAARSVEGARTFRDEVRCCRAAGATGCFDGPERDALAAVGVPGLSLLRISLPPAGRTVAGAGPNLLFLGDRTWLPNRDGLRQMAAVWPDIRRRVPEATLLVVGSGPVPSQARQPGIEILGFVDSLGPIWSDVRALVAPLTVGGGVRIKILEAAARGVPVIASRAAIGSIDSYLPMGAVQGAEVLVEECVAVLSDAARARRLGDDLYESNEAWGSGGGFQADLGHWLRGR
jgi:glycosyltransferase involved in cell wall biosynthesis